MRQFPQSSCRCFYGTRFREVKIESGISRIRSQFPDVFSLPTVVGRTAAARTSTLAGQTPSGASDRPRARIPSPDFRFSDHQSIGVRAARLVCNGATPAPRAAFSGDAAAIRRSPGSSRSSARELESRGTSARSDSRWKDRTPASRVRSVRFLSSPGRACSVG